MERMVLKLLEEKDYDLNDDSVGLMIDVREDEVLIKGGKSDLIELADYLVDVALLDEENNHLHLDDLTLISEDSKIKNLIIERIK